MSDVNDNEQLEESNESEEQSEDNGNPEAEDEGGIDYQAELNRVREIERRKTGALKEERERRKEAERKLRELEGEEKPDNDISSVVRQVLNEDRLDEILEDECSDNNYRELVKHHYENTIRPSGSTRAAIQADIRKCKLLADEAKYLSEARKKAQKSEAEKAAFIREGKNIKSVNESQHKKGTFVDKDGNTIEAKTPDEKALLKRFGVKQL